MEDLTDRIKDIDSDVIHLTVTISYMQQLIMDLLSEKSEILKEISKKQKKVKGVWFTYKSEEWESS